MLQGRCQLLKIYINEDSKYKSHNAANALISKFKEIDMNGLTVTRGIEGYGKSRELHTVKVLDLSSGLPLIIEVVDTPDKIQKAVDAAKEIVDGGLMFVTDVNIIR